MASRPRKRTSRTAPTRSSGRSSWSTRPTPRRSGPASRHSWNSRIARKDNASRQAPSSRRSLRPWSFDLGDGLAVLRDREDVPVLATALAQHIDELTVADRAEVPNARAIEPVVVHALELRGDVVRRHSERRVGVLGDKGDI